ncbi:potassium-transporting ATPase subunit KdpA [Legionella feeleii]|uniref:Potassium translocating ATPase, subunit A n=1 Tax=Legionella feeleii TaxID=453 RepID=A0A378IT01_9GAMM|nr:potassium-transporting ATPase subunit KdpA [Legionella feeleii]STX38337.1 potassium translocating ATPase, subunit A [Legionella feeleii]
MTEIGLLQIFFYLLILLALVKPLGWYIASVYEGKAWGLHHLGAPLEKFIYRISGIKPKQEMNWKRYLSAMLVFNLFGLLAVYLIQRLQAYLPLNPQHLSTPESAILSAVIFNALIIIFLIPLALRGVKYHHVEAARLLRSNVLIYGLGGLIVPFIGIKLIDLLLSGLGLA